MTTLCHFTWMKRSKDMGIAKSVLSGIVKGIGFLLYGMFKMSSFIIKLCAIIFLFVLQLFLILVHMGTPE
jgi:hypothetical protein